MHAPDSAYLVPDASLLRCVQVDSPSAVGGDQLSELKLEPSDSPLMSLSADRDRRWVSVRGFTRKHLLVTHRHANPHCPTPPKCITVSLFKCLGCPPLAHPYTHTHAPAGTLPHERRSSCCVDYSCAHSRSCAPPEDQPLPPIFADEAEQTRPEFLTAVLVRSALDSFRVFVEFLLFYAFTNVDSVCMCVCVCLRPHFS